MASCPTLTGFWNGWGKPGSHPTPSLLIATHFAATLVTAYDSGSEVGWWPNGLLWCDLNTNRLSEQ